MWKSLIALLLVVGLVSVTAAQVGAQGPPPSEQVTASQGTCADLGLSVVEPNSVMWESASSPVLNPGYMWAYGDVDLLWDNSVSEYWFHWYNAVPGPDPYVVYHFDAGTSIQGVQFTNDWSDGDLQVVGLNAQGQDVSVISGIDLPQPYTAHVAPLESMTVVGIKMTTSTQQVKLLEVDFCGGEATPELDLAVSTATCESIAATWSPVSGASHQITVVDGNGGQVATQGGLSGSYGPLSLAAGSYTVTVAATSSTQTITENVTVVVQDCDNGGECGSNNDPVDAYCDSVNVIDSFGDAPLPPGADTGPPWDIVRDYYDAYGDRPGMCSIDVHNRYWTAVRSAGGQLTYYPSWHPPIHDPGGPEECRTTHDHGVAPFESDLYDEDRPTNIGVPFGFVHPGTGGLPGRLEDHVGHKVIVENDFQLTTNNPYGDGVTLNLFYKNGQPVTCDWYSKLHQGTHSQDALGFNAHEYFLNYSCDDGTELRLKEMTDFGFRTLDQADTPPFALTGGAGTANSDCGWFATNFPGPATDPDPTADSDFGDAGRGFTCLMNNAKVEELWKPSASIGAPDNGPSVEFDPYYVVMNSNRYALHEWWNYLDQDGDHVGENAMISMVDLCVEGSELRNELMRPAAPDNYVKRGPGANYSGQFRVRTFCDAIDPSVMAQWEQDIAQAGGDNSTLMTERKFSVDNTFIGTRRGVHVKGPRVYGGGANFGSLAFFCSDHFGNNTDWPTDPTTGAPVTAGNPWSPGEPTPVCVASVPQLLSTSNNGHNPVEGSTAGATAVGNSLVSGGPGDEIIIDIDALYPGHGIQAPN